MIWNCPHCHAVVSLGIDIDQVKKAYVRCAGCKGVAMISKRPTHADTQSAQVSATNPAETTGSRNIDSVSGSIVLPPPISQAAMAAAAAPIAAPTPAAPAPTEKRNALPPQPAMQADALKKKIPAEPPPENSAAPVKSPAKDSAVHQFEFRETRPPQDNREASRIYQFPKPPQFLTDQDELVHGAFQTVNDRMQKTRKSQTPLSIAVAIAAVIAILSGVYLFVQGQKILKESRAPAKKVMTFSQENLQ